MKYVLIFFVLFVSCKKEKQESHTITYSFEGVPPYHIVIYDITNTNDFSDSSFSASYTKSITYMYKETFRCILTAKQAGPKVITIKSEERTVQCSDTLYPSINCFINL